MARTARTYGSEANVFWYRREQPLVLDDAIRRATAQVGGVVDWIYPRDLTNPGSEPEGLRFIDEVKDAWKSFWPSRGSQQCWDGVVVLRRSEDEATWVLIEAKANEPEFTGSPCAARTRTEARRKIERALGKTRSRLGVHRDFSWMGSYYQYANRLAALSFLRERNVDAQLVFLYFLGDSFPDGRPCPDSPDRWRELFRARDLTLGLPDPQPLSDRIHHIFLKARGH